MQIPSIRRVVLGAVLVVTAGCSTPSDGAATDSSGVPTGPGSSAAPTSVVAADASTPTASAAAGWTGRAPRREFLFQVERYTTGNQGGQVLNMYFHYRYDAGLGDADIPNYVDLRTEALTFMDAVDATANPYWEDLNQQLCGRLHDDFPVEAISCQLQVYPDDRAGLPYEPGFHSSVHTIGDIEPLAVVGPVSAG